MVAAGFSVAELRSDHVAAAIVPAAGVAEVEGFVVDVDTPSASGPRRPPSSVIWRATSCRCPSGSRMSPLRGSPG